MKKGIKAILALCFLSVFGMFFMPLIEVSDAELSVFNILKISVQSGASDSVEIINDLQTVIGTSMMQFIIMYGILVALVLIAVVLVTMLKGKTAYFSSIGMSLGINVYTSVTTLLLISKLKALMKSKLFYGTGITTPIVILTIAIWEMITILIILLSVLGLMFEKNSEPELKREELPIPAPIPNIKSEPIPFQETAPYQEQIYIPEEEPVVEEPKEFAGMIKNTNQQVLVLDDKVEVYAVNNGDIERYEEGNILAKIYYISEYQEYCVEPLEMRTVLLKSGQPLGANRLYYLPRGTEISIKDAKYELC